MKVSDLGHRRVSGLPGVRIKRVNFREYNMSFQSGQIKLSYIAPCKGNQDSLGLWTPRLGFRIPGTSSGFSVSGTWILDCNR